MTQEEITKAISIANESVKGQRVMVSLNEHRRLHSLMGNIKKVDPNFSPKMPQEIYDKAKALNIK